jgi:cysteine desulfurase
MTHTARLQRRLWEGLKASIERIKLSGPEPGPRRIGTNLNISTEFTEGEGQALMLDVNGICVASGTSCVSKALKISHVLSAIGLEHSLAQANIILSLGKDNTDADVDYFLATFPKIISKLRSMSPTWDEFQRKQSRNRL